MKELKNAVCLPAGFIAGAVACGLKKSGKLDLGVIYSQVPAVAGGVFTTNKFAAAPVLVSKKHLKNRKAQAIIVNSANANCFTGEKGLEIAIRTADGLAELLRIKKGLTLIASTGIIGKQLDFNKIKIALPGLVKSLNSNSGSEFARAIMTTDTKPKELAARIMLSGKSVTIGGVAKGAGMIAPDMATMLCFITSDAFIQSFALEKALKEAVENSFNMISIDGCMSTNDTVIMLANGLAKNKEITNNSSDFYKFLSALKEICLGLAKMIVRDAEGATKFISIKLSGAKDSAQAKKAALQIANSNLFKTAVYGESPNLGRIVAAIGAAGVKVSDKVRITCSSLKRKDIDLKVDLGVGKASATLYTSDLTPEYIRINAEYN